MEVVNQNRCRTDSRLLENALAWRYHTSTAGQGTMVNSSRQSSSTWLERIANEVGVMGKLINDHDLAFLDQPG